MATALVRALFRLTRIASVVWVAYARVVGTFAMIVALIFTLRKLASCASVARVAVAHTLRAAETIATAIFSTRQVQAVLTGKALIALALLLLQVHDAVATAVLNRAVNTTEALIAGTLPLDTAAVIGALINAQTC